jgi:hypothetical protein
MAERFEQSRRGRLPAAITEAAPARRVAGLGRRLVETPRKFSCLQTLEKSQNGKGIV